MRWILLLLLLIAPLAEADDNAHLIAFTEGRYIEAAAIADTSPTADNLVFAARSLLAEAMSAEDFVPPQDMIVKAERLARKALRKQPDHTEGRLQLAIALTLRARPMTNGQARRSGFGDEAKTLAETVLEDDPHNHYANGFMAVWHIEVRRRGGTLGASIMGASVKQGRRHYKAALRSGNIDASTHWQYARALTALNARKYRDEIDAALNAALSKTAETELEVLMQNRARSLKSVLNTGSRKVAEKRAAEML